MTKTVCVVGGGIAGLAAAHKLSRDGYQVTLLESSSELGGLGTYFKSGDNWIDKFYHCQMPTDEPLLELIDAVGLSDQLYWKNTRMGFTVDGVRYPFNTAIDLLKFKPLRFIDRIRLGAMSLLVRYLGKGKDLDNIRIEDWFTKLYGKRIWDKIFLPLFRSKFGSHAGDLPALYIWQRMGREKNVAKRGYLSCGLKGLIDGIAKSITEQGGVIRCQTAVEKIEQNGDKVTVSLNGGEQLEADWLISTAPIPVFSDMIRGTSIAQQFTPPNLLYQGVVNALFFLKRPLDNFYWSPVVDSGTDFDGVVEMAELINIEQYGDRYLVYTMKYCERSTALFTEDEAQIAERWKKQLMALYADIGLSEDDFDEVRIFKAPFVEPIYPLGYTKIKPPIRVGESRVLLASSAQVYPNITSWNASTGLANEVVDLLYRHNN